jgi:trehalose synthase-fused probable maltokinase
MGSTIIDPFLLQIQQALPVFLVNRRWYRSKARQLVSVHIQDVATANGFLILLAQVQFEDGETDSYLVPATSSAHQGEFEDVIATLETEDGVDVTVYGALSERGFRDLLFKSLACGASFPGQFGEFVAEPSAYFQTECAHMTTVPDSRISRAEQSNSSIIYGDRYITKLFRKLEAGINPDIEIGQYLTRHKFPNTPSVLGLMEYKTDTASYAAALLQEFVPNQGDAWKHTLDSLGAFFGRALAATNTIQPSLPTQNILQLMKLPPPSDVAQLIGPYLQSAALLGQRTAELHIALSSSKEGAFVPEPFAPSDAEALQEEMVTQALSTLALVREKDASPTLLLYESEILGRFSCLKTEPVAASRIRHHGDYHLGQVLYTGADFMIIDFEGEPARPLAHRRGKTLALKDVAGMVRSFHYAAYAASFGLIPSVPNDTESLRKVEEWADVWNGWVSAAYLNAYFQHAAGHSFAPASEQERYALLNAFLLQKALYEVSYELNNRPGWVGIPIRGILSLVE